MFTAPEVVCPYGRGKLEAPSHTDWHVDAKDECGSPFVDSRTARVFTSSHRRHTATAQVTMEHHARASHSVERPASVSGETTSEHAEDHPFFLPPSNLRATRPNRREGRGR